MFSGSATALAEEGASGQFDEKAITYQPRLALAFPFPWCPRYSFNLWHFVNVALMELPPIDTPLDMAWQAHQSKIRNP